MSYKVALIIHDLVNFVPDLNVDHDLQVHISLRYELVLIAVIVIVRHSLFNKL